MRTPERNREIIDSMTDDELIDFATTCSNRGVALAAEMHLRARYPAKRRAKRTSLAQGSRMDAAAGKAEVVVGEAKEPGE